MLFWKKKRETRVIVSYSESIVEKCVSKQVFKTDSFRVFKGKEENYDSVIKNIMSWDYEMVDYVSEPGHFSIRGGIIDVFSYSHDFPYRIDFFGDTIESVRKFDHGTQKSIEQVDFAVINKKPAEVYSNEKRESLLGFLPKSSQLWVHYSERFCKLSDDYFEKYQAVYDGKETTVASLPASKIFSSGEEIASQLNDFPVFHLGGNPIFPVENTYNFYFESVPTYKKNLSRFQETIQNENEEEYQTFITSDSDAQISKIESLLHSEENKVAYSYIPVRLSAGFKDTVFRVSLYAVHEVLGRFHRFKLKNAFKKSRQATTLKEISNFKPRDYVVHIDHGVGQFVGLETIEVGGKKQEVVKLFYANRDSLYVGIHSLHKLSKHSAATDAPVSLNKLGSKTWGTLKSKAKSKMKALAFDLVKLYAKRKETKGFAFSPDTYLQNELEASFIYEDTPDQFQATKVIKEDMEKSIPMDRLVCGDVGFGKTEVALRAAFKAVSDNKQVALLVPTTVLALQHHRTFSKRLEKFPVTIDYINRFRPPAEIRNILKKLSEGKIDIIIGTHKLVGESVKFKDLGLLIVDEEQKFGVNIKEKLKNIKQNIDVLTLSATPIPRTLQFSMLGARDLSVMHTPPPNRQAIHTEIRVFDEDIIRDAILFEIQRNGQVYFIQNRIETLEEMGGMIKRLLPDIKVKTAHGQMEGDKLEKIILQFIEGEFDVLVSTSIVESGLDIPRVNTIIINQANFFGLSDLHQLRGRVGRSDKKAYCYLLAAPLTTLTNEARKRLLTIEEFSDLSSGFSIALKDLEIRGAGNLLGAEQSGYMNEMGLETYQKILEEVVEELRHEQAIEVKSDSLTGKKQPYWAKDCVVDVDFELQIPNNYINSVTERMNIYKTISSIRSDSEIKELKEELIDRFGKLPQEVVVLLESIKLKITALKIGVEKIVIKSQMMTVYFVSVEKTMFYESDTFQKIILYVTQNPKEIQFFQGQKKVFLSFQGVSNIESASQKLTKLVENAVLQ